MASQLRRVTGNPSMRNPANARLQARISRLPQRMANQQNKALIARDTNFQNQQLALAAKARKQRAREQEAAMGLEAGKLGLNVAMSDMGGTTIGDIKRGAKGAYGTLMGKKPTVGGTGPGVVTPKDTGISKFNVGGALASGLTGYGVGKLVGGKNKLKKAGFGAGAGALMGLLSGGGKGGMMGGLTGGLAGGLGGYFS